MDLPSILGESLMLGEPSMTGAGGWVYKFSPWRFLKHIQFYNDHPWRSIVANWTNEHCISFSNGSFCMRLTSDL